MTPRLPLLAFIAASTALPTAAAQFVETEIDFGVPVDSRLAVPSFNGLPGVILLTGRSASGEKRLALYEVQSDGSVATTPVVEATLSEETLFFDTGRIGGERKLLLLGPAGVSELASASAAATGGSPKIAPLQTIYRAPSDAALTRREFVIDANDDDLDDIVLPDFEGLRVVLQSATGFDPPVLLELSAALTVSGTDASYRADEVLSYDFDQDGLKDLAVIRNNRYLIFAATSKQAFARTPRIVPIDIELADESVVQQSGDLTNVDQSDYTLTQIADVNDLNADGLPDIITFTTVSKGLLDKRTEYGVHLAAGDAGTLAYSRAPSAKIPSKGVQLALSAADVDHDGAQDLITLSAQLGFTQLISALFSRTVPLDVSLYRMGASPAYPSTPDYRAEATLRFSLSTGFVSNPAVRFADFDGDGSTDLLLQDGSKELRLRRGEGREFSDDATVRELPLPQDGSLIEVADANGDGRSDLLIGYRLADGADLARRVRVLVSQPAAAH